MKNQTQEKTHDTNQKKFKMVFYWKYKADGTPYSFIEIQRKMNRKYSDSYDYTQGAENKNITNHRLAWRKMLQMLETHKGKYFKAILIMNDWQNNKEITIGVFTTNILELCNYIEPIFTAPNAKGHVYVDFLPREPLRIDEMRAQNIAVTRVKH